MQELPHHYKVQGMAKAEGLVCLQTEDADALLSAAPKQFGGPGAQWSPETLLVAAVADCFILTFRAIAKASKMSWLSLTCEVEGRLERVDGITRFTHFMIQPTLTVPEQTTDEQAEKLLEKSERSCLITNSLAGEKQLTIQIKRSAE